MSLSTRLTKDIYRHTNGLKQINVVNNDGFSALFVVNTPIFDNSGVAHAVEHMIFRASAAFPQPESLFQLTALTDVKINASTIAETTYFHCQSQCSHSYALAINYLLNGLFHPNFSADDLLCEIHDGYNRGVIYRELIATEHPKQQVSLINNQQTFCYGGISHLIGKLSLSDISKFHQQYYHPSNMTLVTANANINEIASAISLLPKHKTIDFKIQDKKVDYVKEIKDRKDRKDRKEAKGDNHQKKYSAEINQLIDLYHQYLQDPLDKGSDVSLEDCITTENTKQSIMVAKKVLPTGYDDQLILPLVALSKTLTDTPSNELSINASVQQVTVEKSLPNLFNKLYRQVKSQLTKQNSDNSLHFVNDHHNALWLTNICIPEQKIVHIVSYIISAYPEFLAPRCQGLCYAIQALVIEKSTFLAIYSAFDVSPERRLKKLSACLSSLSQDNRFIRASLVLAKIKYSRAYQLNISQLNDISPIHISDYLLALVKKSLTQ